MNNINIFLRIFTKENYKYHLQKLGKILEDTNLNNLKETSSFYSLLYKIHKDDLHKKEIDDVSQFFSSDVHITEKNQIIETPPIPAKAPKELIIEDELDEFLREFESHDETVEEKSKSPIEINENVKNGNNYVSDTISINQNQKEILKNEDLKMTIEYPKEKNNIENSCKNPKIVKNINIFGIINTP